MKEEALVAELISKTQDGKLAWQVVSNGYCSDLIFQPNQVFRIFKTLFTKKGEEYELLLVEKKYDDPEWDFAIEKYRPELLFIQDRKVVLLLDENSVEIRNFVRLVQLAESSTPHAKNLLG